MSKKALRLVVATLVTTTFFFGPQFNCIPNVPNFATGLTTQLQNLLGGAAAG